MLNCNRLGFNPDQLKPILLNLWGFYFLIWLNLYTVHYVIFSWYTRRSCFCRYTTHHGYIISHTLCRPQWVSWIFKPVGLPPCFCCRRSLHILSDSLFMASANTTVCSSVGSSPDARNGPHHVHPADLDDGAPDTAAQPPLHGQQWSSQ